MRLLLILVLILGGAVESCLAFAGAAFAPQRAAVEGPKGGGLRLLLPRHAAARVPPLRAIKGPVRHDSGEWIQDMLSMPSSRVLKRIRGRLIALVVWTAGATALLMRTPGVAGSLSRLPHGVLSAALSLLLVFRTNSAYARFNEGRTLWTKLISSSREMCRQATLHVAKKHRADIARLLVAHAVSLKQHLQGEINYEEIRPFVDDNDLATLRGKMNWPTYFQGRIGRLVHEALHSADHHDDSPPVVAAMHEAHFAEGLHELGNCVSHCERIVKQPIPLSYNRHAVRYLVMYLYSLPLTLVQSLGWLVVPTMLTVGYLLLALLEISYFVEEPFCKELALIPIPQLCVVLRLDIEEILGEGNFPSGIENWDAMMLKSQEKYVRQPADNYFTYYSDCSPTKGAISSAPAF